MFTTSTQVRVHYALTDQMGMVYHGNYAQFFEIARGEASREMGLHYSQFEKMGIIMPVTSLQVKFIRPAVYDDLLTIKTTIEEIPLGHSVTFLHEVYNEQQVLLATGSVTLYFLDAKTFTKAKAPEPILEKFKDYFGKNN